VLLNQVRFVHPVSFSLGFESLYAHAEISDMPVQGPDGTWWSDDRRYYCAGNQWVLYQETSSVSTSSQQHQPSAQQASYTGTPLDTVSISNVADALSKFPQSSTEPYQQQSQPVFGRNPQTPGYAPTPAISLDPNFRAAAARNAMIWGFTKAMDKMAKGLV
jgi:hypothetical protein